MPVTRAANPSSGPSPNSARLVGLRPAQQIQIQIGDTDGAPANPIDGIGAAGVALEPELAVTLTFRVPIERSDQAGDLVANQRQAR